MEGAAQIIKQRQQLVAQLHRKGKQHPVVKALIRLYTLKSRQYVFNG